MNIAIRRRLMNPSEKGTLIYSAIMNAENIRTIEVYSYDENLSAFECSDISDLLLTTDNVYTIPKLDNLGCIISYGGIRGTLTKVDNTHFTISNLRTEQERATNTLCVISQSLEIPIGFRNTDPITYRLDFEGSNNADAYYQGGPYALPIDTSASRQPSGASNKAYKCKKSVWFTIYWSGSTFYVTTHKVKLQVYTLTIEKGVLSSNEYTDETTRSSFGTNNITPRIFIDRCFGSTTAKLYQL